MVEFAGDAKENYLRSDISYAIGGSRPSAISFVMYPVFLS